MTSQTNSHCNNNTNNNNNNPLHATLLHSLHRAHYTNTHTQHKKKPTHNACARIWTTLFKKNTNKTPLASCLDLVVSASRPPK